MLPSMLNQSPTYHDKSVRFEDENGLSKKQKIKSQNFMIKDKKKCINDEIIQTMKRLKNSSFGRGMDYQFVEKVGDSNDIWMRVKYHFI